MPRARPPIEQPSHHCAIDARHPRRVRTRRASTPRIERHGKCVHRTRRRERERERERDRCIDDAIRRVIAMMMTRMDCVGRVREYVNTSNAKGRGKRTDGEGDARIVFVFR